MYTTRILPPDEWDKLKGTEAGSVYQFFDTNLTNVMVIEKDDEIIASWCLMPYYHAECVWITEEHRGNPTVARRLVAGMKKMADEIGIHAVITTSTDKKVTELIEHFDAEKLPGEHFVIHFRR